MIVMAYPPDKAKSFHLPSASISIYQQGVQYSGIKLFNILPTDLKECADNAKKFGSLLKTYLTTHFSILWMSFFIMNNKLYSIIKFR
jgi:hypothetical protein